MGTFTVMSMQMRNANRIVGVDVARAVALIGMICAHLTFPDGVLGEVLYGFPAALFGLLAGVSMGLMHDRGARPMHFVVRGLIIIAIGMVLSLVPSSIVIVLGTLGICMVVLAWAPGQGSALLAGCAAAAAIVSGLAYDSCHLGWVYTRSSCGLRCCCPGCWRSDTCWGARCALRLLRWWGSV